jgi:hypothetical protein
MKWFWDKHKKIGYPTIEFMVSWTHNLKKVNAIIVIISYN